MTLQSHPVYERATSRRWADEDLRRRLTDQPSNRRETWVTDRIGQVAIRDSRFAKSLAEALIACVHATAKVRLATDAKILCIPETPLSKPRRSVSEWVWYGRATRGRADWAFYDVTGASEPKLLLICEVKLGAMLRAAQIGDYIDARARNATPRQVMLLTRDWPPWIDVLPKQRPYWLGVALWRQLLPQLQRLSPAGFEKEWLIFVARASRPGAAGIREVSWPDLLHGTADDRHEAAVRLLEDVWPWTLTRLQGDVLGQAYGVLPYRMSERRQSAVWRHSAPSFNIYAGRSSVPARCVRLRLPEAESPRLEITRYQTVGSRRGSPVVIERRDQFPLDLDQPDPFEALTALIETSLGLSRSTNMSTQRARVQ